MNFFKKELTEAFASMSVSFTLEDDIDISKGDMIVRSNYKPDAVKELIVMQCWLSNFPLEPKTNNSLQHISKKQLAIIMEILYSIDLNTLERNTENLNLKMVDLAKVKISTTKPIIVDSYRNKYIRISTLLF